MSKTEFTTENIDPCVCTLSPLCEIPSGPADFQRQTAARDTLLHASAVLKTVLNIEDLDYGQYLILTGVSNKPEPARQARAFCCS